MVGVDEVGTFEAGSASPLLPIGTGTGRTVPANRLRFDSMAFQTVFEDQDVMQDLQVPAFRTEYGVKDIDA